MHELVETSLPIVTNSHHAQQILSLQRINPGAKYPYVNVSNFYLATPMDWYKNMQMNKDLVSDEFKQQCKPCDKICNHFIYMEICCRHFGLPQAGIICLLKKRLAKHRYFKLPHTAGLQKHVFWSVQFSLVIDILGKIQWQSKSQASCHSTKRILQSLCHHVQLSILLHHSQLELQQSRTQYMNARLCQKVISKIQLSNSNQIATLPMNDNPKSYSKNSQDNLTPDDRPTIDRDSIKCLQQDIDGFL